MRTELFASLTLMSISVLLATPASSFQDEDRWDVPRLKKSLEELGYEPKRIAPRKWEIKLSKGGFDLPIGAELSESGNYVWLTAIVGDKPSDEKSARLLRRNAKIQPTQFYVTGKGLLGIGVTCDNRAMSNGILRKALDKITDDIVATNDDWSK